MSEWYRDTVWIDEWSWTGHPSQVITTLKKSISNTVRVKDVEAFYIGVASGVEYKSALKTRYDDYKKGWGCNEIWNLYSSTSKPNTLSLERQLVDHYWEFEGFQNRISGGGGGTTSKRGNFLYLALARRE